MAMVYVDAVLMNGFDVEMARRNMIGEDEIKYIPINILAETGSIMPAINENIQGQLQLPVVEKRKLELANRHIAEYDVVSQGELRFKNRRTICNAVVLPGSSEPLLLFV